MIWAGKRKPAVQVHEDVYIDTTDTHWQSVSSLMDFLKFANSRINEGEANNKSWLLAVDCAPVHASAEWRARMRAELGHVRLLFVAAGFTAIVQPLDRSAEEFADDLLAADDGVQYNIDFGLAA